MENKPDRQPNLIKSVVQLLAFNIRAFFLFELAYKVLGSFVLLPLLYGMLNGCMALRGLEYLGTENLLQLVTFPLTWVCGVAFVAVVSFYALVDITATVMFYDMSARRRKASTVAVVRAALSKATTLFKPANLPFILMVMLVMPFASFLLMPSYLGQVTIPEFVLTFITYHPALIALAALIAVALVVFVVLMMYAFHFFVLEDCSFREALRRSISLERHHRLRDVVFCMAIQAVFSVATLVVMGLVLAQINLLGCLFQKSEAIASAFEVGLSAIFVVIAVVVAGLSETSKTSLSYAAVSALYYRRRMQSGEGESEPHYDVEACTARPSHIRTATAVCLGVGLYAVAVGATVVFYNGMDVTANGTTSKVEVVARRCGAGYAPENTVAALRKASQMGAEWCELDVQMCADGTIIVLHDSNFARVTGVDANTWELTYDEVEKLDAGSSYGSEYAGEKVPTLREMIEAAKECGMKLQIEIKPTGHDEGIEQAVADIIREEGFQDDCQVLSFSLECLQKVKAYDPSIRTTYLMAFAYGDLASIEAADSYSIESTWVTPEIAANVHSKEGALLCAWTVSTGSGVQTVIENGADQVVTDDIEAARAAIADEAAERSLLLDFLGMFSNSHSGAVMTY